MSTEQVPVSLPFVGRKKTVAQHPLGPLTPDEITESARLIKGLWPSNTSIQFKSITLQEPDKAKLVPFLAAEHAGRPTPTIERQSFVLYYIRNTVSTGSGKDLLAHFQHILTFVSGQTSRGRRQFKPR